MFYTFPSLSSGTCNPFKFAIRCKTGKSGRSSVELQWLEKECQMHSRVDTRFAPSQWETALLFNDVSHWLGASQESVLHMISITIPKVSGCYVPQCHQLDGCIPQCHQLDGCMPQCHQLEGCIPQSHHLHGYIAQCHQLGDYIAQCQQLDVYIPQCHQLVDFHVPLICIVSKNENSSRYLKHIIKETDATDMKMSEESVPVQPIKTLVINEIVIIIHSQFKCNDAPLFFRGFWLLLWLCITFIIRFRTSLSNNHQIRIIFSN